MPAPLRPDSRVTSTNCPLPVFRNRRLKVAGSVRTCSGDGAAVQEEKVHETVAVVVEGGDGPAECLERVLELSREVLLDEVHAPRLGLVDEDERRRRGRSCALG